MSQLSDPFPLNSTNVVATTTVTTKADLAIFKFGPNAADSDSVYPYTIHVTNNGPSVATNVRITDSVPAAIQSLTAGAGWTCTTTGNLVSCVYGPTLNVQATTTDINLTVKAPAANVMLSNSASVGSDEPDAQLANNTAMVSTSVSNCHPGLVDAAHSSVMASPASTYADNFSTARLLVTLRDACDNVLSSPPYDPQQITLTSSRPTLDTVSLAGGFSNPTNTGQVGFDVKSGTVGASTYSVSARDTNTNANANLAATAQVAFNTYACVDNPAGVPLAVGSQKFLQFAVANHSGFARRLTAVNFTWPRAAGQKVDALQLQSTILWHDSNGNSNGPLLIGAGGLPWDASGTSAARTLGNGASNQTLQFDFSKSVGGTGTFILTTTWDDGTGARTCTTSIRVTL